MNSQKHKNIHATCIDLEGKGVLLLGKSSSGKSDLALRLIGNKRAVLVADDRVDLWAENESLYAASPEVLQGLIEVRGIGVVKMDYKLRAKVCLAVELVEDLKQVERMPKEERYVIDKIELPLMRLFSFEASAADKVVIKLNAILD